MSDYEKVRFFLTLVSSSDRSDGECYGLGRGAMLDGTFLRVRSQEDGSARGLKW